MPSKVYLWKFIFPLTAGKAAGKEKDRKIKKGPKPLILFGSGERIRTSDLWVMSPTSYRTAPPRVT